MAVSVSRAKGASNVTARVPPQPAATQPAAPAAPAPVTSDPLQRKRHLGRLRRIEGQLRGLQRMVEQDRACSEVLTQMASVHEALRAVARELLRDYLKQRAVRQARASEGEALGNEIVDLIQKYSR